MYSFRYNPVYQRWVMVGPPVVPVEEITAAHRLDIGQRRSFTAATFPRHLFVLDADDSEVGHAHAAVVNRDMLYTIQAPVGEYEVMLYDGDVDFWQWDTSMWDHWFMLIQHRLNQLYRNPHLQYVSFHFHTSLLFSLKDTLRVGDLWATSHPLEERPHRMDSALATRLRQESLFTIYTGAHGWLYVPSAPLHEQEVWYLPYEHLSSLEKLGAPERKEASYVMSNLMGRLHDEWPEQNWVIELHTALVHTDQETTWWLQIYKESTGNESPLPVKVAPEGFVHILHQLFGHL
jgi:hypothetical protein